MSFNNPAYFPAYNSNRGMTDVPNQHYVNLVNYYTPKPVNVGGGRVVNSDGTPGPASPYFNGGGGGGGGLGLDFSQFFQPAGGAGGGMAAMMDPRQLAGRAKLDYNRMMAQGKSPFRHRTGGSPAGYNTGYGAAAPPPATINPQHPIGGGGGGGLTQADSGITAGQLSNDSIQAGLQQILQGGLRPMSIPSNMSFGLGGGGVSGGLFGDLMRENTMRSSNDFSRAASQQQADMQHAFEVARANGGLQQMQLVSDTNRENVMNDVTRRNTILDLLARLLGGFGNV